MQLLIVLPSQAGYQFYGTDLDFARWKSSGNRLECSLSQVIPGYGEASFKHRATKPMVFRVSSDYVPRKDGQALLFVRPPEWKQYANSKILGRVPITAQKDVIVVPEDWAYRVALELREGMETVWTHPDWADGQDLVTAKVLPLSFEPAWRDFQRCRQGLINYTFSEVRYSEFYFAVNSANLSASEKARLNKVAEYVVVDPDFKHISIKAFSDSKGVRRLNLAISRKRANAVKNYLIKKGVNPRRFVVVASGEKKPKYNNRTKKGRAKNRRVEVTLVR